jgi:hypothetical protein
MLSPKYYYLSLIYAICVYIYIEYLSVSYLGYYISLFIFLLFIVLSILDYRRSVLLLIVMIFTVPSYSRALQSIYEKNEGYYDYMFYNIKTIFFGGFVIIQWMFMTLFFISVMVLIKEKKININDIVEKNKKIHLFLLVLIAFIGLVFSLNNKEFELRRFITDIKYPVLFLMGIYIGVIYYRKYGDIDKLYVDIHKVILFIVIVSGLKVVFYLISDVYYGFNAYTYLNNSFFNISYLFSYFLYGDELFKNKIQKKLLIIIMFLSVIPDSRGVLVVFLVNIMIYINLIKRENNIQLIREKNKNRYVYIIAGGFLIWGIINLNESLLKFMEYKMNFFTKEILTGEISESPAVRLYEFLNIISLNINTFYGFFVGQGAGSYFKYDIYGLPFELKMYDYSIEEISIGRYYLPHTPINYWLLKGGVVGLSVYIYFYLKKYFYLKNILQSKKINDYSVDRKIVFAFMCLSMFTFFLQSYWLPEYVMVCSIMITIISHVGSSKNSMENCR